MTAPLRPQSAERPALQKFRTALNALYLEVEPSIANDIVALANAALVEAEAYARAAAPRDESHPSNQLYLAADAANKFLNTVGLDPSERRKQRNEIIRLLTDALHNCAHPATDALAHSSYLASPVRLGVGESPAAAPAAPLCRICGMEAFQSLHRLGNQFYDHEFASAERPAKAGE